MGEGVVDGQADLYWSQVEDGLSEGVTVDYSHVVSYLVVSIIDSRG